MISRLGLQTEEISPQEVENCTSEQSHSAEEQVLEMQFICAKADSHVHISWKLHIQGSAAGAPIGADSGAGAGAAPGARNVRSCVLNNIRRLKPLRVEVPETTNNATTATRRVIIELDITRMCELN